MTQIREITHFHLFCGLGGGAKGFNNGQARVGNLQARFRCLGGIDNDPAAIRDFNRLAGVPGTVLDLFSRAQYVAFHGKEPSAGWREATTDDIRRAAGNERPNIVFLSAPCKGFSGLLSETRSRTNKYQALNGLTLRGVWLMLESWADDPVELIVFENVPRIASRGRHLLDQIVALLRHYGYAVAETTHDCGELGGLAQSRKRFLLVARHQAKVPPFLYEPEKRSLRAVGDILGRMPLPGDGRGGPMHRIPSLQWKTWVRLAFVEADSDWRSLNRLNVVDGKLADYLIVPDSHNGFMGVNRWDEPSGTVAGASRPGNGNFSVADPRPPEQAFRKYQVVKWSGPSGTVIGGDDNGAYGVADPRHVGPAKHSNEFRVVPFDGHSCAVTGAHGTGQCVADPRPGWDNRYGNLSVMDWEHPSNTVIAGGKGVQGGWLSVADPRWRDGAATYLTGGHYGVVQWDRHALTVSGSACHDNGWNSVADPRGAPVTTEGVKWGEYHQPQLPPADERLVAVIRSLDGTWHRPFTTMELAALQSLLDPEEVLELDGLSDSAWRERIGNAVPPEAAAAIAGVMGTTLLLAWSGQTFVLSSTPIWVRQVAVGLSVQQAGVAA